MKGEICPPVEAPGAGVPGLSAGLANDPKSPPAAGAAGVVDDEAPAAGVALSAGFAPKSPPDGAGVLLPAAGVVVVPLPNTTQDP